MAQAGFKQGTGTETAADLLARLGPTLLVDIGLKSRAAAGEPPDLPAKRIRAIIDTGAGGDCIDDDLAQELKLPIIDEGEVSGVGGRHRAYVYIARLYIPALGQLLYQPFTGVKLTQGDQWHRVILGRSFLRPYRLIYDGETGAVEAVPLNSSAPASDRYVSLGDNQASEIANDLAQLRESVRTINDIDQVTREIALSEVMAFEATVAQPRVAAELIERFARRVLTWIGKHFADAAIAAVAAALIAKLLPLLAS